MDAGSFVRDADRAELLGYGSWQKAAGVWLSADMTRRQQLLQWGPVVAVVALTLVSVLPPTTVFPCAQLIAPLLHQRYDQKPVQSLSQYLAKLLVYDRGPRAGLQGRLQPEGDAGLTRCARTIGSQHIQQMGTQDYEAVKEAVMEEVKAYFRPEMINRIDEVVVFHGLNQENIRNIAKIQLKGLEKRLEAQHLHLKVDDAALDLIAKAGFDPVYGARPLKRAIQSEIENPLAKALLEGKYAPDSTIHVKEEGGKLVFA